MATGLGGLETLDLSACEVRDNLCVLSPSCCLPIILSSGVDRCWNTIISIPLSVIKSY